MATASCWGKILADGKSVTWPRDLAILPDSARSVCQIETNLRSQDVREDCIIGSDIQNNVTSSAGIRPQDGYCHERSRPNPSPAEWNNGVTN